MEELTKTNGAFIEIGTQPKNIVDRILKYLRIRKPHHKFILSRLLVGNLQRVAKQAALLPNEMFGKQGYKPVLNLCDDHLDKLIYMVAVGIQNNRKEPGKKLLRVIREEFSIDDLNQSMHLLVVQMGINSFINCIVLIKGASVLQSPNEKAANETID